MVTTAISVLIECMMKHMVIFAERFFNVLHWQSGETNEDIVKGTYYHGEYKTPGEVSEAVSSIDTNGMQYILDCCEKYSPKIRNLKAYITSLIFTMANSCQTTIRSQIEENSNSSFDVYKLDQWALEQYATGF